MSENKLVGSLILRTIDIDPTKAAPTTIVTSTDTPPIITPKPNETDYGLCTANGGVIT